MPISHATYAGHMSGKLLLPSCNGAASAHGKHLHGHFLDCTSSGFSLPVIPPQFFSSLLVVLGQQLEVRLCVFACRTYFRSLGAFVDVAAVGAMPLHGS